MESSTQQPQERPEDIAYSVAEEIVGHLELMYPAALKAVPKTARVSLKNFSQSQVKMALDKERDQLAESQREVELLKAVTTACLVCQTIATHGWILTKTKPLFSTPT